MPYVAPDLTALRERALRDLRDDGTTFTEEYVDDFINEGLTELDRFRPREAVATVPAADIAQRIDLATLDDEVIPLSYIWAVEIEVDLDGVVRSSLIPSNNQSTAIGAFRNGWDYYGNTLDLGPVWGLSLIRDAEHYTTDMTLRVLGYRDREALVDEADVADLDSLQEEMALRKFVGFRGFKALEQDRSLFQQWLTQANNSDVSPTQLMGMVGERGDEWRRLQHTMARVRRPAMG